MIFVVNVKDMQEDFVQLLIEYGNTSAKIPAALDID
jgi:hypothetical protein